MFDYLQQFNSLPKALRDKVSSSQVMTALTDLEKRYRVDLAMVVMRVMIKNLDIDDLPPTFVSELGLAPSKAEALAKEMRLKIFSPVADYVGLNEESEFDLEKNIDEVIKQAGISIASEALIDRFAKILATYLKGVRSRIDARHALSKDVTVGGLGLSDLEIDRVFKVCDLKKYEAGSSNYSPPSSTRLQEIMTSSSNSLDKSVAEEKKEKTSNLNIGREYDLKRALQSGETKPIKEVENKTKDGEKKLISEVSSDENKKTDSKEDEDSLRQELEQELGKLETGKSEGGKEAQKQEIVASNQEKELAKTQEEKREKIDLDKFKKTEVEGKSQVDKVLPIVNKPESSSFFKKLFSQEKNKLAEGIKLAEVAGANVVAETSLSQTEKEENKKSSKSEKNQVVIKKETEKGAEIGDKTAKKVAEKKAQIKSPSTKRPQVASSRRPRLDDIRAVPKVMGPLEELQYLSLENFRRLGKNPEEITNKVFNKIKMLEKDGYDRLIAGISAWKKSPVNRLYLKSLNEAMTKGMTVKEANKQAGSNSLSFEEIEAIINLNSRLVF